MLNFTWSRPQSRPLPVGDARHVVGLTVGHVWCYVRMEHASANWNRRTVGWGEIRFDFFSSSGVLVIFYFLFF